MAYENRRKRERREQRGAVVGPKPALSGAKPGRLKSSRANFVSALPSPKRLRGALLDTVTVQMNERKAAARVEHDRRVAAGYLAPTEHGKRNVSRLNISALEPLSKRHHEKVRDLPNCKKKPEHNRPTSGSGKGAGLRKFIPWCS